MKTHALSISLPILGLVVACGGPAAQAPGPTAGATSTKPAPKPLIPWVEDDLTAALAQGKQAGKPVFIDMWATWCHSCLSMQKYVLADPALAPLVGRFVWAAIDTEKEPNARALESYPVDAYPTFLIVDPADGTVAGRWIGSMSVNQVRTFLEEGERAVQLAHAGQIPAGDPLSLLRDADRAEQAKRHVEAARLYARARQAAPAGWPRRAEALSGEIRALERSGDVAACADLALAELASTGNASNAADFTITGLECAGALPKEDPRGKRLIRAAHDRLLGLAQDAAAPLSADDRGDIWRHVWATREVMGDPEGAKEAARSRLGVLDAAAASAPDAEAASTYDGARLETLLYLGRGADAVRVLSESERRLPRDYNPPARLARAYLETGKLDDALAAIDRALGRAYGPRKLGLFNLKADILEKMGRRDAARATIEEQLAFHRALPAAQQRPSQEAAAKKRLETLR